MSLHMLIVRNRWHSNSLKIVTEAWVELTVYACVVCAAKKLKNSKKKEFEFVTLITFEGESITHSKYKFYNKRRCVLKGVLFIIVISIVSMKRWMLTFLHPLHHFAMKEPFLWWNGGAKPIDTSHEYTNWLNMTRLKND